MLQNALGRSAPRRRGPRRLFDSLRWEREPPLFVSRGNDRGEILFRGIEAGHLMWRRDGCRPLMRLGPLRNGVRRLTIILLRLLIYCGTRGLSGLVECVGGVVKNLRGKHGKHVLRLWHLRTVHRRELASIRRNLRGVGGERSIRVLLEEGIPHTVLRGNVVVELAVEHERAGMQMGTEALILGGEIFIFFLVHLLVDDILLSHTQATAGSLLVDLRRSTRRFYAGFEATITASRCGNVGTLLVLFVSPFGLGRLGAGRHGPSIGRHDGVWDGPTAGAWQCEERG